MQRCLLRRFTSVVPTRALWISLALWVCDGTLGAQQSAPPDSLQKANAARDSLTARLARAEAAIELLRQQLGIEASSAVRTRSRLQLELSARLMTNSFLTSGRANMVDLPTFALAEVVTPVPAAGSPGTRALGLTLRQSRLGAALSVDSVLGSVFEGDFDIDFFGGVSSGPGDRRLFPEPRLRTARARLRWDRTTVMIGSETPLISDLNPISVASVGTPGFVAAGNLWNWLPQVRVSHDLVVRQSGVRVGVQGAVLTPNTGVQHRAETDAVDAGERSGRPFVQGRANLRWGKGSADAGAPSDVQIGDDGGEIGIGVHRGWLRATGSELASSHAISIDGRMAFASRFEVRGEAYRGQLLRGLGGGGIGQTFGTPLVAGTLGPPIRSTAGWLQANVQTHVTLIAGAGCGSEVTYRDDRPLREANRACATHLLWRPAQPLVIGMEFRTISTRYAGRSLNVNHVNLSFGFEL